MKFIAPGLNIGIPPMLFIGPIPPIYPEFIGMARRGAALVIKGLGRGYKVFGAPYTGPPYFCSSGLFIPAEASKLLKSSTGLLAAPVEPKGFGLRAPYAPCAGLNRFLPTVPRIEGRLRRSEGSDGGLQYGG